MTEGGRFTGSAEDSRPEKIGNNVEEKTLKTRQRGQHTEKSQYGDLECVIGIGGAVDERKVVVIAWRSRYRMVISCVAL
jgi:hypothetical protein